MTTSIWAKLISCGGALPISSLLLHAQLKERYPSSCLKREANNKKKKSKDTHPHNVTILISRYKVIFDFVLLLQQQCTFKRRNYPHICCFCAYNTVAEQNNMHICMLSGVHVHICIEQAALGLSLSAACVFQAASPLCFCFLEEKPVVSNCICAQKMPLCLWMRATLLSGISRSCYCNSPSPCSLLHPLPGQNRCMDDDSFAFCPFHGPSLRASIPTPATVDFAMETGHGYHD